MVKAELIPFKKFMHKIARMNDTGYMPLCMAHIASDDGPGYIMLVSAAVDDLPINETENETPENLNPYNEGFEEGYNSALKAHHITKNLDEEEREHELDSESDDLGEPDIVSE